MQDKAPTGCTYAVVKSFSLSFAYNIITFNFSLKFSSTVISKVHTNLYIAFSLSLSLSFLVSRRRHYIRELVLI
jgi:hypothetical protein